MSPSGTLREQDIRGAEEGHVWPMRQRLQRASMALGGLRTLRACMVGGGRVSREWKLRTFHLRSVAEPTWGSPQGTCIPEDWDIPGGSHSGQLRFPESRKFALCAQSPMTFS